MKYSTETCDTIQQALDLTSNNPTRIKLHFVVPRKFSKRGTKKSQLEYNPIYRRTVQTQTPKLRSSTGEKGAPMGIKKHN